jgi:hypothetical protein
MIIGQNGKEMINMQTRPPSKPKKSYSAFVAVGGPNKPHVDCVREGCVVKTTEVEVQGSSLSIVATDEDEDEVIMDDRRGDREGMM